MLVGSQTALATVLVAGAILLGTSLRALTSVDPGIDVSGRVAVDLVLPALRYRDTGAIAGFYTAVLERVRALPGLDAVTAVRTLPLRDQVRRENVVREGATRADDRVGLGVQASAPGVLRALGIPLLEGRDLTDADRSGSLHVGLLNRTAARALWPDQPALGKRLRGTFLPERDGLVTIVGIYEDVRSAGLSAAPTGELILPMLQADGMAGWVRDLTIVAHTSADTGALVSAIRNIVTAADPGVAVERPVALPAVLRASAARERFLAALLTVFSTLALLVASVGVFGVVSFSVARQRREIAIRKALGAGHVEILLGILGAYLPPAAAGACAGAVAAAIAAPAMRSFLYQVPPRSGPALLGAPLILAAVALAACLAPAVRAMRQPAAAALRDGE